MNPYKLGPYSEGDAFFGRSKEINEMYRSFIQNDYLVCYANSGEGKSSILNAGLFPKMKQNMFYPINIRFKFNEDDSDSPDFDQIIGSVIEESTRHFVWQYSPIVDNSISSDNCWQEQLIMSSVWLRLRYGNLQTKNEHDEIVTYIPVLVFDQFEEVFTNASSELWTQTFFDWLQELSTDVCPKRIVKLIEDHDDEFEMCIASCCKRFKAIFSLRSEYVGNVDYWGLQHFYIPDLKNNRYFLKPLTPDGAKEVIMQQDGFPYIQEEESENILYGCCSEERYIKAGMPCIPASILAIVCHEIYSLDNQNRQLLFTDLVEDKGKTIETLLEHFYQQTLIESGINNEETQQIFENTFVDEKNNRRKVNLNTKTELSKIEFKEKFLKKLIDAGLIRVIEKNKENLIVEIVHDRFCSIINRHIKKRQDNQRVRLLKRTENITVISFLSVISCFIGWCVNSHIISNIVKIAVIKDCSFMSESWYSVYFLFTLTLLPFLAVSISKRLKSTKRLVGIGLLLSIITGYMYATHGDRSQEKVIQALMLFSFFFLSLPVCLRMNERCKNYLIALWDSLPLRVYLLLISLLCYYLSIWNVGSEPIDSAWGLVIIPVLFNEVIRYIFESSKSIIIWIILGGLVCVLCGNAYMNFVIPLYGVFIVVLGIAFCFYLTYNACSLLKRSLISLVFFIITSILFCTNLGFCFLKIEYSSQVKIISWKTVIAKDKHNRYGLRDAISGDTIIPYIFSEYQEERKIDNRDYYHVLSFPINKKVDVNQCYPLFVENDTCYIECSPFFMHKLNDLIRSEDSMQRIQAELYKEQLDRSLYYLKGENFDTFTSNKSSYAVLYDSSVKQITESLNSICQKPAEIEETDMLRLLRSMTYYSLLDYLNIVNNKKSLDQYILPFMSSLFIEIENVSFNFQFDSNFNFSINNDKKDSIQISFLKVENRQLRENKLYAWERFFSGVCCTDINFNCGDFVNNINSAHNVLDPSIIKEVESINKELKDINTELKKNKKKVPIPVMQKLMKVMGICEQLNLKDTNLGKVSKDMKDLPKTCHIIMEQLKKTINKVDSTDKDGIYNDELKSVYGWLQCLYFFRGYNLKDYSDTYDVNNSSNKLFKYLRELKEDINNEEINIKNKFQSLQSILQSQKEELGIIVKVLDSEANQDEKINNIVNRYKLLNQNELK
ncbi:MAG: hypothetical protein IJV44_10925 [Prevotella sp.]|nr:hypothetical protein [Prevotella sp.]